MKRSGYNLELCLNFTCLCREFSLNMLAKNCTENSKEN